MNLETLECLCAFSVMYLQNESTSWSYSLVTLLLLVKLTCDIFLFLILAVRRLYGEEKKYEFVYEH